MTSFTQHRLFAGLKAGADLSAALHCAVKLSADNTVVLCGAGEKALGFLMNAPKSGEFAEVAGIGGGAKGIAAATLATVGTLLKSDAAGHLVAVAADGDWVVARSLEAAVDNDHFSIEPLAGFHHVGL
jgi:hypothetical protein